MTLGYEVSLHRELSSLKLLFQTIWRSAVMESPASDIKRATGSEVYRPFLTLFIHGAQILFANLKHIHFSNERRWVWRSCGGLCRIYSVKEFARPLYLGRFGPLFTPICSGRNVMAGNGKSRQFFGALCTRCSHKLCQLALILRIYNIPYYF